MTIIQKTVQEIVVGKCAEAAAVCVQGLAGVTRSSI
jgi:hypothetical protein